MPSRRRLLAGLVSAPLPVLAGCRGFGGPSFSPGTDADVDWPLPRFDAANSGYTPDAKAPRDSVRERWTVDVGMATGTPAIVDGTVFLPTVSGLVALDAASGTEQWRFTPVDQPWPTAPVVHEGIVYVTASDEDSVHAVDATTGKERWSIDDTGHAHAAPHLLVGEPIDEPVLYVGTEHGELLRLDPSTGEITWRTDLFGAISSFGYRFSSLYVGTRGGELYAFHDSVDGVERPTELWRRKVGSAVETILPDEGCVLVDSFGGPLRCLRDGSHAGTTRWSIDAKWASGPPVSAANMLFAAGYDAVVAARNRDGRVDWRYRGRFDATGPIAAGDTLYVSSGDAVHGIALEGGVGAEGVRLGAKRWSHPTPAGAVEGLAVADGAVFAACQGGEDDDTTLYCLEAA